MSMQIYLGSSLGSGRFGTVFRGDYHGTPVAVKVVGATPASMTRFSQEENTLFDKECEVMRECIHDNIVQYLHNTEVDIEGSSFPALVMTLMETDLRKFVGYASIDLPPHKEVKIAHDVAKALNYLHGKQKIVHGDLHTGNVLLQCITAIEGPLVKLGDFGLAQAIYKAQLSDHLSRSLRISEGDKSLIKADPVEVEIRRFGTVMWEIHSRYKQAVGSNRDDNLQEIENRPLYDVVCQCWDDEQQPTAEDLTKILKKVRHRYPVIDPHKKREEELLGIIKSRDEQISKQTQEISKLTQEISKLTSTNKSLVEALMEKLPTASNTGQQNK